jgi:hypothetical protein
MVKGVSCGPAFYTVYLRPYISQSDSSIAINPFKQLTLRFTFTHLFFKYPDHDSLRNIETKSSGVTMMMRTC